MAMTVLLEITEKNPLLDKGYVLMFRELKGGKREFLIYKDGKRKAHIDAGPYALCRPEHDAGS